MPLLGKPPAPLPPRRRPGPPLGSVAATSAVGSGSFAFDAQGFAPFAAGSGSITMSTTAVGASTIAAVGSGSITFASSAVSSSVFPLSISADGRYFKQADGAPFLICGQSVWSLGVNLPIADLTSFLNTITGQGFNTVLLNAIEHFYTTVKPPKERGGLLPFTQRLDGSSYTGSPNGTSIASGTHGQFAADNYSSISTQAPDPTFINNSYWTAIESVLNACLQRNVCVFVWPAYLGFHADQEGWLQEMVRWDAVTGAGGFTGQSFADPTKSKMWNYGAWLAARWKTYPNIVWMAGGDYGANTQTLDTQQRAAVTSFMQGMKSVSGQASTLWGAHWERPCISDDTTITGVTWDLNFCYADEAVAELCRRGYNTASKPAILGEYNYENGLFGGSAPWRKYLWWGFLGGIAGGYFGNEPLWRVDTDYATSLNTTGAQDAARVFSFLKSKAWHRLKPSGLGGMGTLITVGGGTASPQSTSYVAAACTPEGDLLLAYIPPAHTGSITVDMTKMAASSRARWYDPSNGALTDIGVFLNTGTRSFTPPATNGAGDTDFLLVLEASSGSGSIAFTSAAVGGAIVAVQGAGGFAVNAQGVGAAVAQAVGSGSFAFAAAAQSGTVIQAVGSASISFAAAGAGARLVGATGTGALAFAAAGVGAATAAAVGQGSIAFQATGQGSSTGADAVGSGGFGITALGVGAAIASGVGTASISFAAHGVSDVAVVGAEETFADLVHEMDDLIIEVLG